MTVTIGKLPARFIAHCLAISFAATAAFAEERRDYVSVSQAAFATLECSVLAAHARYNSEEKRLFSYGMEQTRLFIQAVRAGRVSKEDFNRINFVWPLVLRVWNFPASRYVYRFCGRAGLLAKVAINPYDSAEK